MSGLNLLVFRGSQRRVCGHKLKVALADQLRLLCGGNLREPLIGALLRAGELECGLADADGEGAHAAELLTDRIAEALLQGERCGGRTESDFQTSNSPSANFQNISFQTLLDAVQDLPAIEQLSI